MNTRTAVVLMAVAGNALSPAAVLRAQIAPSRAQPRFKADSTSIVRYLRQRSLKLDEILAHAGPYYGVISKAGTRRTLAFFNVDKSASLLTPAILIGDFTPDAVVWISLAGKEVDGVLYTFDQPDEDVVGTHILALEAGKLRETFRDDRNTCKPSELKDVNRDGMDELVSYVGDPSNPSVNGCRWLCYELMEEQSDAPPTWIQVSRWTDVGGWVPDTEHYRPFYAALYARYRRAVVWLGAKGAQQQDCKPFTMKYMKALVERAQRAG